MLYGYSLKLQLDENLSDEINQYFMMYDVLEIKMKEKHLYDNQLVTFINELIANKKDSISIHLTSDLIRNFNDREKYFDKYINTIRGVKNIVTHLQNTYDPKVLHHIISKIADESIVLLENESGDNQFIDKYIDLKNKIGKPASNRIKMCFDVGHCNNLTEIIRILKNNTEIANEIQELHIHSNVPEEHSLFKKSDPSLEYIQQLIPLCRNLDRIILEMKHIDVLTSVGEEQIQLIK